MCGRRVAGSLHLPSDMKHTPLPSASTGFRPILTTLRTGPSRSQLTQPSACGLGQRASMGDGKVVSRLWKGVVNSPPRSSGFNLMHLSIRADDSAPWNAPKTAVYGHKARGLRPAYCLRVGTCAGASKRDWLSSFGKKQKAALSSSVARLLLCPRRQPRDTCTRG